MTKKITYLALLLVLAWPLAWAQNQSYQSLKLFDLATAADVITYGTITKVDSLQYTLQCQINGKKNAIKVERLKGKKGAFRWLPYEEGQRVFVFLKKTGKDYTPCTKSFDSEILMVKDTLIIDMQYFQEQTVAGLSPKGITPEYKAAQTFTVGKRKIFGLKFTPDYVIESIEHLRNCYQVLLKEPNTNATYFCFNFFDRYPNDKINTFKYKNRLMRLMYYDMEIAQKENCKQRNSTANK